MCSTAVVLMNQKEAPFLTQDQVTVHRQLTLALVLMMLEHILDFDKLGDPHATSADDYPPVPHCSVRSPCMTAQCLAATSLQ